MLERTEIVTLYLDLLNQEPFLEVQKFDQESFDSFSVETEINYLVVANLFKC